VAILTAPGVQYGCGRMIATLAEMRGVAINVFMEEAEAQQWLDHGPARPSGETAKPSVSG
jgi:uncharacterized protein (DUF2384 family)